MAPNSSQADGRKKLRPKLATSISWTAQHSPGNRHIPVKVSREQSGWAASHIWRPRHSKATPTKCFLRAVPKVKQVNFGRRGVLWCGVCSRSNVVRSDENRRALKAGERYLMKPAAAPPYLREAAPAHRKIDRAASKIHLLSRDCPAAVTRHGK